MLPSEKILPKKTPTHRFAGKKQPTKQAQQIGLMDVSLFALSIFSCRKKKGTFSLFQLVGDCLVLFARDVTQH